MDLSQGRKYLAIPGPSVVPDRVLQAMHRASPNIYSGEIEAVADFLMTELRALVRTQHEAVMYIGNGHAAWEASLANVIAPNDKVLALKTGYFGQGWAEMAAQLGANMQQVDFAGGPIDPQVVAQHLANDPNIKAVLAVHTDTATSVRSEIAPLADVIKACNHDALLMADCIASLGCDPFEMDAWGVDVTVSACQKGLMTPAGMAFNWFGPKALAAREQMPRVSPYWDWLPRLRSSMRIVPDLFGGTPPTHHLFGLQEALGMIADEGLEQVWARHGAIARAVWAAVEHWGGEMTLPVPDPNARSNGVTSIGLPHGGAAALQDWCRDHAGLTLGLGFGRDPREDYFRIGHMGHVNGQMILGALATIEAGLSALSIDHNPGGAGAAARVLAASVAAST